MARFDKGWVKLEREISAADRQTNPFYGDGEMKSVYITLLNWARYKDGEARYGATSMAVKRGQVLCSTLELQNQDGFSREVVRRSLRNLEKLGFINQETSQRGSIITVLNYGDMQDFDKASNQDANQKPTNTPPIANQDPTNTPPLSKEREKEEEKAGNPNMQNEPPPIDRTGNLPAIVADPLALLSPGKTPWTKTELKALEKKVIREKTAAKTALVWQSYRSAYYDAYGIQPADNARVRSQASQLIDLLTEDEAIAVADWYVRRELGVNGWLVVARHPFGELVSSYHTYHGNMLAGVRITPREAKRYEANNSNQHEIEKFINMKADEAKRDASL